MVRILILALALSTLPMTSDAVPPSDASLRLHRFNQEIGGTTLMTDARRGALIREWFERDLSTLDIDSMQDGDLEEFYVAALNAASLAREPEIAVVARRAFHELGARQLLQAKDYRNMQGLYVRLRNFDEARRFRESFASVGHLEEIPEVAIAPDLDETAPSRFSLSGDGTLELESVALGAGEFVLVVADPVCHFTQDAVVSIQDDAELREYFAGNSLWVAPDGLELGLDALGKWNRAFPQYELGLVNDIRDWTGVDYWDTPTFYFYENGKVVRTIRGWPPEGHVAELKEAIRRTGP